MNLHGLVRGAIKSVNPDIPVELRISTGAPLGPNGRAAPSYATPGAITASITDGVMTVTAVGQGKVLPGQTVAGAGIAANTVVNDQITGDPGGTGTYSVSIPQTVPGEAVTLSQVVRGQVQPIGWRDLQHLDGINLGGVRWKVYLYGKIDAVVRPENKGGDLVIIATGPHQGTWLVNQVLEQWPDWCCAAITLQNGG